MKVGIGILASATPALEISTADTAVALRDAGVDVTLFADAEAPIPPRASDISDRVVRLAIPARSSRPLIDEALFLPSRLRLSRSWARALAEHPVELVHTFSPGTAALLPRSTAVVLQGWFHPARATLRSRLRPRTAYGVAGVHQWLPGRVATPVRGVANAVRQLQVYASDALGERRADAVLAATDTAARHFARNGRASWRVPPCLAVPERLPPRDPADRFRITCCAHPLDRPWKGVRHLLAALPLLSGDPPEVTLIGGRWEPLSGQIEAARAAGVVVHTPGRLARGAYLEHLAQRTDLAVAPAIAEEWGYVVFEALSRGVPVVAFDVYPYSEIIDDELGLLVEAEDPAALAAGIDAARHGQAPSRDAVLEACRRRFGADAVAARLVEVYEHVLRGRES